MGRFEYLGHRFHNQRPYWLQFLFTGQAFTLSHRVTVVSLATTYVQISTNSDRMIHLSNVSIATENEQLQIQLIKEPTFTTGSTPIPVINLDDRSAKTESSNFYSDPTGVSGGTILFEDMIPQGAQAQGGLIVASIGHFERILDYDTDYIIAITNEGNSATDVMLNITFYESSN